MTKFAEKEMIILRKKFGIAHVLEGSYLCEDAPHVGEMRQLIDAGKNVYVWGKSGVGKTFSASVMLQQLIEKEIDEKFVHFKLMHMYDLEDEFRKSKRFDYEGDPLKDAKFPRVLVLDDVGSEKPTEDMVNMLKRVLDYREEKNLQTVFLSNFSKKDLIMRFNSLNAIEENVNAVKSRMNKNCVDIHFTGTDRRSA